MSPALQDVPGEAPPAQDSTVQVQVNGAQAPSLYEGFQRGLRLAIMSETLSVTPARHTTLIGQFKNTLTHNGIASVILKRDANLFASTFQNRRFAPKT